MWKVTIMASGTKLASTWRQTKTRNLSQASWNSHQSFPEHRGTRWRSWSRHCATSRMVAGSFPNGVTLIFHWHNPSSCTMALGLTQPLSEMSTRNISQGIKAAGAYGWQPYHLHVPNVLQNGCLNLLVPSGPVMGLLYLLLDINLEHATSI